MVSCMAARELAKQQEEELTVEKTVEALWAVAGPVRLKTRRGEVSLLSLAMIMYVYGSEHMAPNRQKHPVPALSGM
jgi:hypothetical protein